MSDLRTQYQQAQNELDIRDSKTQSILRELTAAKQQAAQAEAHAHNLQKLYEDQSRELNALQVVALHHVDLAMSL